MDKNETESIELQCIENRRNTPLKIKCKNRTGDLKEDILYNNLNFEELSILRQHKEREKKSIRTVYKYREFIHKHEEMKDKQHFNDNLCNNNIRIEIFDWVVGLQEHFSFSDDTLHFCFYLLDSILIRREIAKDKHKLLGIASILIAQKFEENDWPSIDSMLNTLDKIEEVDFDRKSVVAMEKLILKDLNYNLDFQNPLYFLRSANRANNLNTEIRTLGKYFMELMIYENSFTRFSNKIKAATALYTARKLLCKDTNKNLFLFYANVDLSDLRECFEILREVIQEPCKYVNLRKKYTSIKTRGILKKIYKNNKFN